MKSWIEFEESNKRKSAAITTVIVVCIALLGLVFGFRPPEPPLEPEGLTIDFGNSATGLGSFEPNTTAKSAPAKHEQANQETATQDLVETIKMPDKKDTKPKTDTKSNTNSESNNNTPKIDDTQIFDPGKLNNKGQTGNSEGNTNQGGNQGNPDGSMDGHYGTGSGQGDDGSVGWSLDGRNIVSKPKLSVDHNVVGDVVIKIYVDKNGKVYKAEYERSGSTISDPYLVNQAKNAALKATFNANSKAPDTQVGYITFHFKLQ
ncbi:MAG: hypothetical protein R2794_04350 [Chitinophagales bacterium]